LEATLGELVKQIRQDPELLMDPKLDLFDHVNAAAVAKLEDDHFDGFKSSRHFRDLVNDVTESRQQILGRQGSRNNLISTKGDSVDANSYGSFSIFACAAQEGDMRQLSFGKLLNDKLGLHILKKFCRQMFQEAKILFWMEVRNFKVQCMLRLQSSNRASPSPLQSLEISASSSLAPQNLTEPLVQGQGLGSFVVTLPAVREKASRIYSKYLDSAGNLYLYDQEEEGGEGGMEEIRDGEEERGRGSGGGQMGVSEGKERARIEEERERVLSTLELATQGDREIAPCPSTRSRKVVRRDSKIKQQLLERERLIGAFDELHSKIFRDMQGKLWVEFQRSALLKAWKNKILDRMHHPGVTEC
jgi:hypothetical protein